MATSVIGKLTLGVAVIAIALSIVTLAAPAARAESELLAAQPPTEAPVRSLGGSGKGTAVPMSEMSRRTATSGGAYQQIATCKPFSRWASFGVIETPLPTWAQPGGRFAVRLAKWDWARHAWLWQDTVTDYNGYQRYKIANFDGYGWWYDVGHIKAGLAQQYTSYSAVTVGLNKRHNGAVLSQGFYVLAYWNFHPTTGWSKVRWTNYCEIK